MRRPPSPLRRASAALLFVGLGSALALGGCGARSALDDEPIGPLTDAGTDADPALSAEPDAAPPPVDAGAEPTVVECGACVMSACGDVILSCVQEPACRDAFQCAATTCFGGGGGAPNPACLLQCAGKDPKGGLGLFAVFQCVTGDCGPDCASVLGGLGGLGGGPPGGGKRPAAFAEVFSPWPELTSGAPAVR